MRPYSDGELLAIASAARRLAASAATLRQAVAPRDARRWATATCDALWRVVFAVSPARFREFNVWKHRELPALLRSDLPELAGVLTRIRWAAERIAPCIGVYQLVDYRQTKLDLVADEHVFLFIERIRSDELGKSIRDLRGAAGELESRLAPPIGTDMTTDIPKKNRRLPRAQRTLLKFYDLHREHCQSDAELCRLFAEEKGKTFSAVEKMLHRAKRRRE